MLLRRKVGPLHVGPCLFDTGLEVLWLVGRSGAGQDMAPELVGAGPLSIGGTSKHPVAFKDGLPVERDRYNTATEFLFTVVFPRGTQMVIRNDTDNGILIEGEKGTIFVNRGRLTGGPVEALKDDPLPEGAVAKVYKNLPIEENERKAHWANFLYCAKNRLEPISDVHSHMKMLNICHLAGISARLGRSLKWDAAAEQIVGDEQANSMLGRPYRAGYEIEMADLG